ncbi:unnamed protein product [Ectocarpus fasciculatus]
MVRSAKAPRARPSTNATNDAPPRSTDSTTDIDDEDSVAIPPRDEGDPSHRFAAPAPAAAETSVGAGRAAATFRTTASADGDGEESAAGGCTRASGGLTLTMSWCPPALLPPKALLALHRKNCRRSAIALEAMSPRDMLVHPPASTAASAAAVVAGTPRSMPGTPTALAAATAAAAAG